MGQKQLDGQASGIMFAPPEPPMSMLRQFIRYQLAKFSWFKRPRGVGKDASHVNIEIGGAGGLATWVQCYFMRFNLRNFLRQQ